MLSKSFNFTPGSRMETVAALIPFILFFFLFGALTPLFNFLNRFAPLPNWLMAVFAFSLLGLLVIFLLIGLVKGLPRWALPYLGVALSFFSVYTFGSWLEYRISFQKLYGTSWYLGQLAYQGSLWIGLTVMASLFVFIVGLVPALQRFRRDWTLLCFLLYGVVPFAVLLAFDDYVNEHLYVLLAYLVLAFGVWFYLHSDDTRKRFLALFGGLTAALLIVAVGKAILFSSPEWPWPRDPFTWQHEMMTAVIMWLWIALSMLISMAIKFFPHSESSSSAA